MKLTDILNEILCEIGDTVTDVSNAQFTVEPYYGVVKFNFENANYTIDIDVVIKQESKIALVIDFYTGIRKFSLVGHNKPLQLMAFIVSAIETWLLK